ncbi:hypothetical protein HYPBUDRAFT_172292 [Hyphopichia burtonii NRRL Y-1933]|uniref:Uncharacterized protein n=1 Tax=Hyphopichia burtonii NRRL Y-1933 TaxID=984485 RepID=A0A1E4RQZ8_9ASCO|nr:hypothetical protein HYPBUDRAFT_172292 [Hyphopichia burtonii NRRL Y-1933]ODV69631.1 hypothetical protein HYPBUDRAFT_172292 [Hyphopichia burtonii NRRL Y-1933]
MLIAPTRYPNYSLYCLSRYTNLYLAHCLNTTRLPILSSGIAYSLLLPTANLPPIQYRPIFFLFVVFELIYPSLFSSYLAR